MTYTARTFNLPELTGISKKQLDIHLALYEGYVKHTNLIAEKLASMRASDAEGNTYPMNELRRRFGFEFDGMRMHEHYFEQFEGGATVPSKESELAQATEEKYGKNGGLIAHVKEVTGTRGIGWVVVYADPVAKTVHTVFVGDHEVGQLSGLPIILALDLWEHAYMVDYVPAEKKSYVDAFFENLNWSVCEARYQKAVA